MIGTETLVGVSLCVLYYSHADTFTMKSIIALAIAMPFLTPSAHAYALETQTYTCKNYLRTERVVPGHYDKGGNWVSARIIQSNRAVPCDMPHATHVSHGYHQQNNYYPQQYPQHQQQPLIINNQPPAQRGGRCDQLARMGLGAGGGSLAGYYIGGGKQSSNTIRNTTIGAVAGGIIGRILPC